MQKQDSGLGRTMFKLIYVLVVMAIMTVQMMKGMTQPVSLGVHLCLPLKPHGHLFLHRARLLGLLHRPKVMILKYNI